MSSHLSVAVLEGRNLAACDLSGFSDPWCQMRVYSHGVKQGEKQRSKVISQTLNPTWNEVFTFAIEQPMSRDACLRVKVWDEDKIGRDFMGIVSLPLSKVRRAPLLTEGWHTLERRKKGDKVSGEIRLRLRWGKLDSASDLLQPPAPKVSGVPHKFETRSNTEVSQCVLCLGVVWPLAKAFYCPECHAQCHASCREQNESDDCLDAKCSKKPHSTVIDLARLTEQGYISEGTLHDHYSIASSSAAEAATAATHLKTKEEVAVRIIGKADTDLLALAREILVMKELHHANIVAIREVFQSKDTVSLVIDRALGGELSGQKCSEHEAQHIIRDVCAALSYCAEHGVAHTDLKPSNVHLLEGSSTQLRLANFGITSSCLPAADPSDYTAPERVTGTADDFAADMWSVGVLAFSILSGRSPFGSAQDSKSRKLHNAKKAKFDFEDAVWRSISDEARSFVEKSIHRESETRLTAAAALEHPWIKLAGTQRPLQHESPLPKKVHETSVLAPKSSRY